MIGSRGVKVAVSSITDTIKCVGGFCMLLGLLSCRQLIEYNHNGKTPLVALDENFLYEEDLRQIIPYNLSFEDSVKFANDYLQNWIAEQMLYRNALRNISDTKEIDKLVDNYRRSLIVHKYQKKLIDQKLIKNISEDEVSKFYDENNRLFILEEPVIKGLLIKLPLNAPELDKVRKLYRQKDASAFEELEKYAILNAVRYDFFYDKWQSLSDIETVLPKSEESIKNIIDKSRHLELKDEDFLYFLNVDEYIARGNVKPLEYAREEIKSLLINNKEVDYMQRVKNDLFESAINNSIVKFYIPVK
ncbi:MAG TPA: peptidylprolyl isomerase [Bacteroidaceae bacterium]|nr:peptidylprolyl isomerase [Bacteroidaceae bacterium]